MSDKTTDQVNNRPSNHTTDQVSNQMTGQENNQPTNKVKDKSNKYKQILVFCSTPRYLKDLLNHSGYKDRKRFRLNHIQPLIEGGLLSMIFPEKPKHRKQKYVTTEKGMNLIQHQKIDAYPEEKIIIKNKEKHHE